MAGFISNKRLDRGPWQAFERTIARLLAHSNWDSYEVVGKTGDQGADVIATKGSDEYIFQVKFRNQPLNKSSSIVKDVHRALRFYGINNGICVTNTRYSESLFKEIKKVCLLPKYFVSHMERNYFLN